MVNIWQDSTKSIPRGTDSMIVRVPMDQIDISGRKDHLPNAQKSGAMSISHVPNKG
jgi:hypothetical protein